MICQNSSNVTEDMAGFSNPPSNDSQAHKSMQSQLKGAKSEAKKELGRENRGICEAQVERPDNELYHVYEYPELPQEDHYESPSAGIMATKRNKHENVNGNYQEQPVTAREEGQSINDGYSQLVRQPYENEHPPLNRDQGRNEEEIEKEETIRPDDLSYVDVVNKNYSPLVRSSSQNYENETPLYTALNKRTNEEADKLADKEKWLKVSG